jgi:phosphopentomutase
VLDLLQKQGLATIAVGKINDIFAGVGISEAYGTSNNEEGMALASEWQKKDFTGLCFINFVDFDTGYGHRRDAEGYAEAVMALDQWLGDFMQGMNDDDILMITADHGCDPNYIGTDHTRENVPFLMYGKMVLPINIGKRSSFSDIAATIADIFEIPYDLNGRSFKNKVMI